MAGRPGVPGERGTTGVKGEAGLSGEEGSPGFAGQRGEPVSGNNLYELEIGMTLRAGRGGGGCRIGQNYLHEFLRFWVGLQSNFGLLIHVVHPSV